MACSNPTILTGANATIKKDVSALQDFSSMEIVCDCSSWEMTRSSNILSYSSCSTAGARRRRPGIKEAQATLNGFMDSDQHISTFMDAGDIFNVELVTGYNSAGTTLYGWRGKVIVASVQESYSIEEQALVRWSSSVLFDGYPSYSAL